MRTSKINWRRDLTLAGKAALAALAASTLYAVTWVKVTWAPAVSAVDVGVGLLCVAAGVVLFGGALRLAGVRDPWVGGAYISGLTVVYGAWFAFRDGVEAITPTTWMAVAAGVAVIYAMHRGSPASADAD